MKNKWRMPHPATMFLLLTMAVVFLSWICDIYGLKVTLPQTGEDIRDYRYVRTGSSTTFRFY